ncbi:PREDICTED: GATA transcription factor 19-like [Ipomoea nil]|uniref:GATA transcription factor 19-like n=1 Tax=Ipomoea nil TaxID=35883 RepID=UPI0009009276|nr:PREDICTED: GATA transcription factor 19-like [Ipomoea nil]
MMHRCSSSCSCGMYNQSSNDYSAGGFSMFFSSPPANQNYNHYYYNEEAPDYDQTLYSSSSSSSVDCTLSLGTPSTRLTSANERPPSESRRSLSSSSHKSGRGGGGGGGGADPLVTRRCANCDTTSTPLWRNGPRGPKSLCNACGIRFKKEERRASAAAAAAAANGGGAGGMDMMHNSWAHHTQMPYNNYSSPPAYGNEYGYMEDDDRDSAFLSWRLNVHCS